MVTINADGANLNGFIGLYTICYRPINLYTMLPARTQGLDGLTFQCCEGHGKYTHVCR